MSSLPARSCAKSCNRSTLPCHSTSPLANRSFFFSRYSVALPPAFPPRAEPTFEFSSFCTRPLQPQPLHRSPLRLQLISLVLGRPFSNFEFLRWTRTLSIGKGAGNDRGKERKGRRDEVKRPSTRPARERMRWCVHPCARSRARTHCVARGTAKA